MKISWTPASKITYFKILTYLDETWTKREVKSFIDKVEMVLNQISKTPYMFEASRKRKNVRKCIVTKHNIIYYRVKTRKKEIELITFWDTRQSSEKLVY